MNSNGVKANGRITRKSTVTVSVVVVDDSHNHEKIRDVTNGNYDEETDIEEESDEDEDTNFVKTDPLELNYFIAQSKRTKPSKSNLKDIDLGFLQYDEGPPLFDSTDVKSELLEVYKEKCFPEWFYLMREGFNIILYGVGSKRNILESFREEWLQDEYHFVIFGMFQELSPKQILQSLGQALSSDKTDENSIMEALANLDDDVFILIHSFDFLIANNVKLKSLFPRLTLASNGKIHLLCTTDHVNSGLLFNSHQTDQLKWLWFKAHTFQSFTLERGFVTSGCFSSGINATLSQHLTLASVEHVHASLTPNAQQIFLIILRYHLEGGGGGYVTSAVEVPPSDEEDSESEQKPTSAKKSHNDTGGLPFSLLYHKCREEFLVNSEITLRSQLIEFTDHKLIRFQKGSDGGETVVVLIDLKLIKKFLDKVKE